MGVLFDIQYGAIYDGPGLRTCVYFKGCPLRCIWCHNPESHLARAQMAYLKERCTCCGKCVVICPEKALQKRRKSIVKDQNKCRVCGKCARVCPSRAREKIGWEISVEEVVERVLRDMAFYQSSGGGVTISGGEATAQADFLVETLTALKQRGIHTALETCGYFKTALIDDLLKVVDLFLFDLKHVDSNHHQQFTGVANDRILANFEGILHRKNSSSIIPRIPLIPGFNADLPSISAIIDYLNKLDYSGPVHLLPYNSLAKTKWTKIGRGDFYHQMGTLTEEELDRIKNLFSQSSLSVSVLE